VADLRFQRVEYRAPKPTGREQVCHALSWISDLRLRSPKQFSREPNQSVSVTDQPWIIAIAVKDESSRISRNFVPYFLNNLL